MKYVVNGKTVDALPKNKQGFDAMLQFQQAPGLKTATTRCAGVGRLGDHFTNDKETEYFLNRCKALGHKPNETDVYIPQLAEQPGDPKAFCAKEDVESRVKQVCTERGLKCDGDFKV